MAFLEDSWEHYVSSYVSSDGYVVDRTRDGGPVTSEGQAYALMRAAWMEDRPTFERILAWTELHLRRPDGLYSWHWTPEDGGRIVDPNTAADADQDVAFALLVAAAVFDEPDHRRRAAELLAAIRRHETIGVGERGWVVAAGNWAVSDRIVNLSYLAPYAYPYFEAVDRGGGWLAAIDTAYDLLHRSLQGPERRLPPDFLRLTPDGELLALPTGHPLARDFSFDAVRVYWRVALDCLLHRRPRACADPARSVELQRLIARDGRLVTRYRLDGTPLSDEESLSFYGATLPALRLHAPATADAVLSEKLSPRTLRRLMRDDDRYYDLNWVWFGLAAHEGLIRARTPPPPSP